jgi:Ni,Fe-hydrogenase I small subunit
VRITRRQFLKFLGGTAAALGISQVEWSQIAQILARPNILNGANVLWVQGQTCGGCITAFADVYYGGVDQDDVSALSSYTDILTDSVEDFIQNYAGAGESITVEDVLLDVINLQYMNVVMAPAGDAASSVLYKYMYDTSYPSFVLIVEGAIPNPNGMGSITNGDDFCGIGHYSPQNQDLGMVTAMERLIARASAVIAYGNCASFGNVPGATNAKYDSATKKYEHTDASGVFGFIDRKWPGDPNNYKGRTINITCCPGHPEALLLTVVDYLVNQSGLLGNLDTFHRPKSSLTVPHNLFEKTLHNDCPRLAQYGQGFFASKFGDTRGQAYGKPPCLWKLGCQGQDVRTPCHTIGWSRQHADNPYKSTDGGTNISCIHAGMPCVGCGERGFPETLRTEY